MDNDDLIICRCEEVSYKTLKDTAEKLIIHIWMKSILNTWTNV